MLISPGQKLFGVSAKLLQFAAMALGDEFNTHHLAIELGASPEELVPLLSEMVEAGWIVRTSDSKARYEYEAEAPWRQLRLARTGKPLPRAKADEMVVALLQRIKASNRAPRLDCGLITRVAIFGSYLDSDKAAIGDIDIAFSYAFPEQAKGKSIEWGNVGIFCVERNAAKVLKNQSPFLSVTHYDSMLDLGCKYEDVYNIEVDLELWSSDYGLPEAYPELYRKLKK